jgi:hypothetical protein
MTVRGRKMKKLIFYSILILTALSVFLTTCAPEYEEVDYPGYIPPDLNFATVTVYLDGNGSDQSRAMSLEIAKMGCDYFEVIFKHSNGTVARGQWRIGERAIINNVYRTLAGENYGSVSFNPPTGGSAILMAGKSDKTLMAIGRLTTASALITTSTQSVTFNVSAIVAGARFDGMTLRAALDSSFFTAGNADNPSLSGNISQANSIIQSEEISGLNFMAFKLKTASTTKARYTFGLHSGTFADYINTTNGAGLRVMVGGGTDGSIILGGAAGYGTPKAQTRQPSYTTEGGGNIEVLSSVNLDERTVVTIDNNSINNDPFNPVVEFTFDTTANGGAIPGSIFAFVFEIPVYALNRDDAGFSVWYIRPGYGVFKYELDDGLGGLGGALLFKTGEVVVQPSNLEFQIAIISVPTKWRYRRGPPNDGDEPNQTNPSVYDRGFRSAGINVQLQKTDGTPYYTAVADLPKNTVTDLVSYEIGGTRVPSRPANNPWQLPDEFYGLIEVKVIYIHENGLPAYDYFFILASNNQGTSAHVNRAYDYANINNIQHLGQDYGIYPEITTQGDLQTLVNDINNNGFNRIRIVRLRTSVNIGSYTFQGNKGTPNNTQLIMFVSTADDDSVIFGRADANTTYAGQIKVSGTASGLSAWYFGKWPFAGLYQSPETVIANTRLGATRDFTVNVYSQNNTKMISDNNINGGIYNVQKGKGLIIAPSGSNQLN